MKILKKTLVVHWSCFANGILPSVSVTLLLNHGSEIWKRLFCCISEMDFCSSIIQSKASQQCEGISKVTQNKTIEAVKPLYVSPTF
jgi:hypothetical protein